MVACFVLFWLRYLGVALVACFAACGWFGFDLFCCCFCVLFCDLLRCGLGFVSLGYWCSLIFFVVLFPGGFAYLAFWHLRVRLFWVYFADLVVCMLCVLCILFDLCVCT